jgi:hypothetical protein
MTRLSVYPCQPWHVDELRPGGSRPPDFPDDDEGRLDPRVSAHGQRQRWLRPFRFPDRCLHKSVIAPRIPSVLTSMLINAAQISGSLHQSQSHHMGE